MVSKIYPLAEDNNYTRKILAVIEVKRDDVVLQTTIEQVERYATLVFDQWPHQDLHAFLVVNDRYLSWKVEGPGNMVALHDEQRPVFVRNEPSDSLARQLSEISIHHWNY